MSILRPDDENLANEAKANPRAAITRMEPRKARAYGGQRNHDLRIGPQPKYVQAELSYMNHVIIPPLKPGEMRKICEERRKQRDMQRGFRTDSNVAFVGIIAFGKEAQIMFSKLTFEEQEAAYLETAQAIAARANTTLEGLVSHVDETGLHAHYGLPAFDLDGMPMTATVKKKMLYDIQTITAEVMARHCPGIERGKSKASRIEAGADLADTVHLSVQELHEKLPADIAAKKAELAILTEDIEKARERVDEMESRVQKLAEKQDLTEKEQKRLATYENRLDDRKAEYDATQKSLEALRAQIDLDRKQIDEEKSDLKIQKDFISSEKSRIKTDREGIDHDRKNLDRDRADIAVEKSKIAAEKAEIAAERSEMTATFWKKSDDLNDRENLIREKTTTLKRVTKTIQRAIDYLGEKLGLKLAPGLVEAIDQIETHLDDLATPESPSDPFEDSGPGL